MYITNVKDKILNENSKSAGDTQEYLKLSDNWNPSIVFCDALFFQPIFTMPKFVQCDWVTSATTPATPFTIRILSPASSGRTPNILQLSRPITVMGKWYSFVAGRCWHRNHSSLFTIIELIVNSTWATCNAVKSRTGEINESRLGGGQDEGRKEKSCYMHTCTYTR